MQTRPISEASPIKAELESIYNNGSVEASKTSVSPPPASTEPSLETNGGEGKEIVFTTEEEEQAKKAAVKAMEAAFARKKKLALEEEEKKKEAEKENEEVAENLPVPVQRTSIKKKTEYVAVRPSAGDAKTSIKIGDFSSSGTDYTSLSKPNSQ